MTQKDPSNFRPVAYSMTGTHTATTSFVNGSAANPTANPAAENGANANANGGSISTGNGNGSGKKRLCIRIARNPKMIGLILVLSLIVSLISALVYVLLLESNKAAFQGSCQRGLGNELLTLIRGHEDMTARFFKAASRQYEDENLVMSPLSLGSVMAMAAVGAKGENGGDLLERSRSYS